AHDSAPAARVRTTLPQQASTFRCPVPFGRDAPESGPNMLTLSFVVDNPKRIWGRARYDRFTWPALAFGCLFHVPLERPRRDLAVRREPDIGKPSKIFQNSVQDRADERPTAKMTMQRQAEVGGRLAQIEIVERFLIDIPQHHRACAQHSTVAEITRRDASDPPARGRLHSRQVDVERVAVPHEPLLDQEFTGMVGPCQDRADPAGRSLFRNRFKYIERLSDRRLLLIWSHVSKKMILQVAMAGEVVPGLNDRPCRFRPDLGAPCVDAEGTSDIIFSEQVHEAPDSDLAAVCAPRNATTIKRAWFEGRTLHAPGP